jgi:hypothetical protein
MTEKEVAERIAFAVAVRQEECARLAESFAEAAPGSPAIAAAAREIARAIRALGAMD